MTKSKKLIEIKGTNLQKKCLLLESILLIIALLATGGTIYTNANNIENNFFSIILAFAVGGIFSLLLLPIILQNDK